MRRWLLGLAALGFPAPVLACAACAAAAADRSNAAFIGITILLSVLPLAMIAGGLLWIARHARGRLAGEFEERDSLAGATLPAEGAGDAVVPQPPGGTATLLATPGAGGEA